MNLKWKGNRIEEVWNNNVKDVFIYSEKVIMWDLLTLIFRAW